MENDCICETCGEIVEDPNYNYIVCVVCSKRGCYNCCNMGKRVHRLCVSKMIVEDTSTVSLESRCKKLVRSDYLQQERIKLLEKAIFHRDIDQGLSEEEHDAVEEIMERFSENYVSLTRRGAYATLGRVMRDLYDSEINAQISWFWDGGFAVRFGDELNGFSNTIWSDLKFEEIAEALIGEAMKHYPDSDFVKNLPKE